jgi:hypothetical protein
MTLTPQLQQIVSIGVLALVALAVVALAFRTKSVKPKPPADDPATPVNPLHSEVVIHEPATFRDLTGFQFREDTLLDFGPTEQGCAGGMNRKGIWGIPYNDKGGFGGLGIFEGGAEIRVRLWMEAWRENPYEAPARYDTLYTWDEKLADLVPLGDSWTKIPHIRFFPGCAGTEPHGGYAPGPKGCSPPQPYNPAAQSGVGHEGKLIVEVKHLGQITAREFRVVVWIAPCR